MGCRGGEAYPFPCIIDVEDLALGQRQSPQLTAIQQGDEKLSEVHEEVAVILRPQPDAFTLEHGAQKHALRLPAELALLLAGWPTLSRLLVL